MANAKNTTIVIEAQEAAEAVLDAFKNGTRLQPFTDRDATFNVTRAYDAAARLRALRSAAGERSIGRKIGFTNRAVWATFGIAEPIWGDVYAVIEPTSAPTADTATASLSLPHLPELKIEPEIVFGLLSRPAPGAADATLLDCIAWMALGFELVHSLYPGWQLRAPDAIADGGLHAALIVGPRLERAAFPPSIIGDLQAFDVTMTAGERDEIVYKGNGKNVLGSPLNALGHLARMLAADASAPPLRPGEVITTGTLTTAPSIGRAETWTARVAGLPLPPLSLSLV